VPGQDFFNFSNFMLEKFRNDERVMMITGSNFFTNLDSQEGYFFSQHFTIWGWATWKRAWDLYDVNMSLWDEKQVKLDICERFHPHRTWRHYKYLFDLVKVDNIDTWDIQWAFAGVINNGLCVTPTKNLVSNIGINGIHSSETTQSHGLEIFSMDVDRICTNKNFLPNYLYDKKYYQELLKRAVTKRFIINITKKLRIYPVCRKLVSCSKIF